MHMLQMLKGTQPKAERGRERKGGGRRDRENKGGGEHASGEERERKASAEPSLWSGWVLQSWMILFITMAMSSVLPPHAVLAARADEGGSASFPTKRIWDCMCLEGETHQAFACKQQPAVRGCLRADPAWCVCVCVCARLCSHKSSSWWSSSSAHITTR